MTLYTITGEVKAQDKTIAKISTKIIANSEDQARHRFNLYFLDDFCQDIVMGENEIEPEMIDQLKEILKV